MAAANQHRLIVPFERPAGLRRGAAPPYSEIVLDEGGADPALRGPSSPSFCIKRTTRRLTRAGIAFLDRPLKGAGVAIGHVRSQGVLVTYNRRRTAAQVNTVA